MRTRERTGEVEIPRLGLHGRRTVAFDDTEIHMEHFRVTRSGEYIGRKWEPFGRTAGADQLDLVHFLETSGTRKDRIDLKCFDAEATGARSTGRSDR